MTDIPDPLLDDADDGRPVEFVAEADETDEIDPEKFGWYPGDVEVEPGPEPEADERHNPHHAHDGKFTRPPVEIESEAVKLVNRLRELFGAIEDGDDSEIPPEEPGLDVP